MAGEVRSLWVSLKARTVAFESGMKRARKELSGFVSAIPGANLLLSKFGAALSIAGAAGFLAWVRHSGEALDAIIHELSPNLLEILNDKEQIGHAHTHAHHNFDASDHRRFTDEIRLGVDVLDFDSEPLNLAHAFQPAIRILKGEAVTLDTAHTTITIQPVADAALISMAQSEGQGVAQAFDSLAATLAGLSGPGRSAAVRRSRHGRSACAGPAAARDR